MTPPHAGDDLFPLRATKVTYCIFNVKFFTSQPFIIISFRVISINPLFLFL